MTTTTSTTTMTNPILFYARIVFCALALLLVAEAVRAAEPNMTPIVTGPTSATVGTPFSYTVQISNVGNGATKGMVTVTDALAPTLAINSVSTSSAMFSCGMSGQTVACTTKSAIAAGAANVGVATINVTPMAPGSVDNSVTVSGGGDASPADNKTWPITTNVAALADIIRALDAPAAITPIPTLSAPMLLLLTALLGLGGMLVLRPRLRA
jgi:uncharacterized repeat protein (TIGR01451 family)